VSTEVGKESAGEREISQRPEEDNPRVEILRRIARSGSVHNISSSWPRLHFTESGLGQLAVICGFAEGLHLTKQVRSSAWVLNELVRWLDYFNNYGGTRYFLHSQEGEEWKELIAWTRTEPVRFVNEGFLVRWNINPAEKPGPDDFFEPDPLDLIVKVPASRVSLGSDGGFASFSVLWYRLLTPAEVAAKRLKREASDQLRDFHTFAQLLREDYYGQFERAATVRVGDRYLRASFHPAGYTLWMNGGMIWRGTNRYRNFLEEEDTARKEDLWSIHS
jgi:hypothetical protein